MLLSILDGGDQWACHLPARAKGPGPVASILGTVFYVLCIAHPFLLQSLFTMSLALLSHFKDVKIGSERLENCPQSTQLVFRVHIQTWVSLPMMPMSFPPCIVVASLVSSLPYLPKPGLKSLLQSTKSSYSKVVFLSRTDFLEILEVWSCNHLVPPTL